MIEAPFNDIPWDIDTREHVEEDRRNAAAFPYERRPAFERSPSLPRFPPNHRYAHMMNEPSPPRDPTEPFDRLALARPPRHPSPSITSGYTFHKAQGEGIRSPTQTLILRRAPTRKRSLTQGRIQDCTILMVGRETEFNCLQAPGGIVLRYRGLTGEAESEREA